MKQVRIVEMKLLGRWSQASDCGERSDHCDSYNQVLPQLWYLNSFYIGAYRHTQQMIYTYIRIHCSFKFDNHIWSSTRDISKEQCFICNFFKQSKRKVRKKSGKWPSRYPTFLSKINSLTSLLKTVSEVNDPKYRPPLWHSWGKKQQTTLKKICFMNPVVIISYIHGWLAQ